MFLSPLMFSNTCLCLSRMCILLGWLCLHVFRPVHFFFCSPCSVVCSSRFPHLEPLCAPVRKSIPNRIPPVNLSSIRNGTVKTLAPNRILASNMPIGLGLDPLVSVISVLVLVYLSNRVALAVCPTVRINVDISGIRKARRLGFSIQILKTKAQRNFVGPCCLSNAHKQNSHAYTFAQFFDIFSQFH